MFLWLNSPQVLQIKKEPRSLKPPAFEWVDSHRFKLEILSLAGTETVFISFQLSSPFIVSLFAEQADTFV